MTNKHTPAPWRLSPSYEKLKNSSNKLTITSYTITGSNEYGGIILPILAKVYNFPNQIEANAHLIAAAPELLEALEGLLERFSVWRSSDPEDGAAVKKAISVIKKARGE